MKTYSIACKFEGRLADQHAIDASDGVDFHLSIRQLLALHAHFFTNGDVPNGGAINHTKEYRILEGAARQGSIEFFNVVEVFADAAVWGAGIKFGALVFDEFLADSIKWMLGRRRPHAGPLFQRKDMVLVSASGNREPIVDLEQEAIDRWERFADRCLSPLIGSLRPVGRCSDYMTIRAGETAPFTIGVEDLAHLQALQRRRREEQINNALKSIRRAQRQPVVYS